MKTKSLVFLCLLAALLGALASRPAVAAIEDAVTLNNDGVDLYTRGFYSAAIDRFQAALTFDPNNAQVYKNMGLSLIPTSEPTRPY